ncbi:ankyrin repeat protein [Megavirus baoshan]|uniref:Ankyrin repeat protein n=1 Tax=Megavirus baoshan TaxID=2496520 RepID=A0A3Q8U8U1_9VIRU|nr:ankyrin repeat protein [Megavirus baoshan]AZL89856.1 ankyrin repeat protein [Megavirus baoshan]
MSELLIFISCLNSKDYLRDFKLVKNYYVSNNCTEVYFFNLSNIKNHYQNGIFLHVVETPKKCYKFNNRSVYHSNKFRILETHSLFDINTYLKYDLNIEDNEHIIYFASFYKNIDFLEWYISSGYKLKYGKNIFFPRNDNLDVSNWWLNSGLELKYDHIPLDYSSKYRYFKVLDWWLSSGLELKYTEESLSFDIIKDENKYIELLNWWINSGLKLKYDDYIIEDAMLNHHINILNWWLDSGLEFKLSDIEYLCCCDTECIKVLDWCKKSGIILNDDIIDMASKDGHINVLNWFLNSGLELKYTKKAMNLAHDCKILQWWFDSGLELLYDDLSMSSALNVEILEWWKYSGLPLRYNKYIIPEIIERNNVSILEWWYNSGLDLILNEDEIKDSLKYACNKIKQWWKTTSWSQYDV